MSMNITPSIPQVVVNAAAPTTEALAKANTDKQVIPATVQTEPYAPQKSREQEARNPLANEDPGTYEDIRNNNLNNKVIPEDEQQSEQQNAGQEQGSDPEASGDEQQNQEASASEQEQEEQAQQKQESAEKQQESKDQQVIDKLESRDREVRAHEQAHAAVGGSLAGSPSYDYQTGPDGKKYAVGGEVSIDVSKTNNPEDTIRKMQTVRAAALAPAEPSSQDRKVAAQASRNIADARAELVTENSNVQNAQKQESNQEVQVAPSQQSETTEGADSAESANNTETSQGRPQVEKIEPEVGSNAASPATALATGTTEGGNQNDRQYPDKMDLAGSFVSKDNDDKTAKVISERYASSFLQKQHYFNAVA